MWRSFTRRKTGIVLLVVLLVCFCAGVWLLFEREYNAWRLVAFQERLHEIQPALDFYRKDNGHYPSSLKELDQPQWSPAVVLSGATYTYHANAPTNGDEILLDGNFRGHIFEIRSKSGFSFK